jgi:phosphatidylinositol-3-phosphatase
MSNNKKRIFFLLLVLLLISSFTISSTSSIEASGIAAAKKKYKVDHIVVVVEENHSYREIFNNPKAPYMNQLMKQGSNLTNHYAIEHPSQPNYLDLFSGSNQGVTDDKTPKNKFKTANLASEIIAHGLTFGGYSEGMPKIGFNGPYDLKTNYARKHNPWVNFINVPSTANMPFTSFPKDYSKLPTVSFVIPNMDHDIHDGTVKEADNWLEQNLAGYVKWAEKNNSLLILTWDEDDLSAKNKIATVIVGPMVKKQSYTLKTNHYSLLRTIEDIYGLNPVGKSKDAAPLKIWK